MRWRLACTVASVFVFCTGAPVRAQSQIEPVTGSGFVLTASGYIATAYHVVQDATRIEIRVPGRSAPVPAALLAKDVLNDLAILKARTTPLGDPAMSFADPRQVQVGQDAFGLGYSLTDLMSGKAVLTLGTVSSMSGPGGDPRLYQISDPVQDGSSGGPLFNKDGQIIGVVVSEPDARTFLLPEDAAPQTVNLAIRAALLQDLLRTVPEGADILRRNTRLKGSREQQIPTLLPWVVQVVNYRATVTQAAREYRRSPAATLRIDALGGRLAFYTDAAKWTETPARSDAQRFTLAKGEGKTFASIQSDRRSTSTEALRAAILQRIQSTLPNAHIVAQEMRVVNGLPLLTVRIEATPPPPDAPIVIFEQLYSGPDGTVEMAATTERTFLPQARMDIDEFLSGVEKARSPSLATAAGLTEWTRRTIRRLDAPLLVRVFARDADFSRYQSALSAYEDVAPGIFVEYVDPDRNPQFARAQSFRQSGALEFEYKGRTLRTVSSAEADITKALVRLVSGPQKIYFTQGHGERDVASDEPGGYQNIVSTLENNAFAIGRLAPAAGTIPADAALVVAAGPATRDFSLNEIAMLKQYLATGGRMLLLMEPPARTDSVPMTNLLALARAWGIEVGNNIVVDLSDAGRQLGTGASVSFGATYPPHPATRNLTANLFTAFPLARSVTPLPPVANGPAAEPLVKTGTSAWASIDVTAIVTSGQTTLDESKGDRKGPISLAAAATSKPTAPVAPDANVTPEARLIVVGDSDFAANATLKIPGNEVLFGSLIEWLTEPIPPSDLSK